MFDKLDDLLARYEEIMNELNEPTAVSYTHLTLPTIA